ncbi:MAG: hypothetical protein H6672_14290 [Anaerolineaceae bacterium]|nr:hypothetical protein [Anaerolineaceae bacterium]
MDLEPVKVLETPENAGGSRLGRMVAGVLLLGLIGLLGYVVAVGATADKTEQTAAVRSSGRSVQDEFARNDDTVTLLMFEADN